MRQLLQQSFIGLVAPFLAVVLRNAAGFAEDPPVEHNAATDRTKLEEQRAALDRQIEQQPDDVELYSQRGDVRFFLAQFEDAVADYDRMVELQSELDSSHWRRGIAYFYAGAYEKAAGQFERYHTFDNVDRENGIWRYLSQVKAHGLEKAREGLLKYEKDDREPFPDVYRLFAGAITPDEILQRIADAQISESEREKRLFYAELYIGLNYAVEDKPDDARPHLEAAARNQWGESAGYGPHYMWRVAGLHRDLLEQPGDDASTSGRRQSAEP
jgi:lipoprotein NlpI